MRYEGVQRCFWAGVSSFLVWVAKVFAITASITADVSELAVEASFWADPETAAKHVSTVNEL